ncbi:MAG: SDR family oxidoreductase [Candidatus Paceibacterota bacterium]
MELKDKVVVITGGTKGLGKAMALSFLENNSKVIVCSCEENKPKDLNEEIFWIKADVTKEGELKDLAEKVVEKFGKLNIWINNAGVWMVRDFVENLDMKKVREMFDVNVFGLMNGTQIAIRYMKKVGSGTIINIISDAALIKQPRLSSSAYMASKYAVNGFTSAVRGENKNISIFSIYPGATKTDLFRENKPENFDSFMDPNDVANKIIENLKKDIPLEELIIKR